MVAIFEVGHLENGVQGERIISGTQEIMKGKELPSVQERQRDLKITPTARDTLFDRVQLLNRFAVFM